MAEEKKTYFLEHTAFPWDITYCGSEKCQRKDCVRHLCHVHNVKHVTSMKPDGLPLLYSMADFGSVCEDYTEDQNAG